MAAAHEKLLKHQLTAQKKELQTVELEAADFHSSIAELKKAALSE
jgi:hypothetical protein